MKFLLQQTVDGDERYFYISGALAFALFGGVVLLFALMLASADKPKSYALKKDNFIAVSVDLASLQRSSVSTKKTAVRPVKPQASQESPKSLPPKADVSSLFSDVWTQKVGTKPAQKTVEVDVKRLSAIERRIKTTSAVTTEQASQKVKSLDLLRPSVELVGRSGSSAAEVNEYLAKIQAFVYEHFYPPANSEGNSAKVRIRLEGNGRMSTYDILVDSGNEMFDAEVRALRERLESLFFPAHPRSESITIDIILIAEE